MPLQSIRRWLTDRENRPLVCALAASLVVWTGASAANAAVDFGAALHDATCPQHTTQDLGGRSMEVG
jgi:hypothetical protein